MKKKIVLAGLLSAILLSGTEAANYRSVKTVETVSVETPAGYVPRLPYRLWVTYSDGHGEYRQVKWMNASEATERAEANAKMNPVGTEYRIRGFIIGDNTTPNGYPVSAQVRVTTGETKAPAPTPMAETLPLDCVTINGQNRLTWNRELDIDQLTRIKKSLIQTYLPKKE